MVWEVATYWNYSIVKTSNTLQLDVNPLVHQEHLCWYSLYHEPTILCINPCIHLTNSLFLVRVVGELEPMPADIGWKAGIHHGEITSASQGPPFATNTIRSHINTVKLTLQNDKTNSQSNRCDVSWGSKSVHLAVGRLLVRCRLPPAPQLLPMNSYHHWCVRVSVCVNGWMRGIN